MVLTFISWPAQTSIAALRRVIVLDACFLRDDAEPAGAICDIQCVLEMFHLKQERQWAKFADAGWN